MRQMSRRAFLSDGTVSEFASQQPLSEMTEHTLLSLWESSPPAIRLRRVGLPSSFGSHFSGNAIFLATRQTWQSMCRRNNNLNLRQSVWHFEQGSHLAPQCLEPPQPGAADHGDTPNTSCCVLAAAGSTNTRRTSRPCPSATRDPCLAGVMSSSAAVSP